MDYKGREQRTSELSWRNQCHYSPSLVSVAHTDFDIFYIRNGLGLIPILIVLSKWPTETFIKASHMLILKLTLITA